ncbi:MAG TPA: phosphoenolpyruvate carboxylase [Thermoplasmata archaeon]|nr:phosphoenolpyruvate carboxylase [Thermoplasmata archaeon]
MPEPPRTALDDIALIEGVLREVLHDEVGPEALALADRLREDATSLRGPRGADADRKLRDATRALTADQAAAVARAFSFHFLLLNLVEDLDRVREHRAFVSEGKPAPDSLEETFARLKAKGVDAAAVRKLLSALDVGLVFTAHPTEPKRRTILERLRRIQGLLVRLDLERLIPPERDAIRAELLREVRGLWQSDELRFWRPRVVDEIRLGLFYFDHVVLGLVPAFYRELERAFRQVYAADAGRAPSFLRFGSWRGSDMDGNPSVTPETMRDAARLQRAFLLKRYEATMSGLIDVLTQSARYVPASLALVASLLRDRREHPKVWREIRQVNKDEHHRAKVTFIGHKVGATLAHRKDGYASPAELLVDLRLVQASLRENGGRDEADGPLEDVIRQVETFGFHLASLDLRLHSRDVGIAVGQILAAAKKARGYACMPEREKVELLTDLIASRFRPKDLRVSGDGARVVEAIRAMGGIQDEYGAAMMPTVVLSMSEEASDILEVLLLAKVLRLADLREGYSRIDICPLFEMISALERCADTMAALYANRSYREHLRLRKQYQEVQVGYSDSMKDGGIFASRWHLYRAQRGIARRSEAAGVRLTVFHGRGGSISRGGEPTYVAMRALAPEVATGRIKVTEQGEVLSSKYFHPATALRETEQLVSGLLLAIGEQSMEPEPSWVESMERMSAEAHRTYQDLVVRDPGLAVYFEQASPIHEIAELNIGSRPPSRKGTLRIEDLRAIPWVFAWMQNRHNVPGWYSIGSALEAERDRGLLGRMTREWPRFAVLLDMAQMVLSKSHMVVARRYAELVSDRALADRIFTRVREEHDRTVRQILLATGMGSILDTDSALRTSVERRAPYLDPLGYIQAELLDRRRRTKSDDLELLRAILLTINGISNGLRNTG